MRSMVRNNGSKKRIAIVTATVSIVILITLTILSMTMNQFKDNYSINDSSKAVTGEPSIPKPMVPLDKIVSGGVPKDGIPSIDRPVFVSAAEADGFLQGSDIVIGVNINGDVRAYPLKILVWHEIVNDEIEDIPLAVTYCPLCFTSQVFNRTVDGQVLEFGVSGKLYNSNLIMYDRSSETLWSQALGMGIVGKYSGTKLEKIPFDLAYWNDWRELYPNSKVLSINTGFGRPYDVDPYGDYYTNPNIYFPVSHRDYRLGAKEVVIGIEYNGMYKAYRLDDIEGKKVINDSINGKPIVLLSPYPYMVRVFDASLDNGRVLEFQYNRDSNEMVDKQTGSRWSIDGSVIDGGMEGKSLTRLPVDIGFWFTWAAFHPDTELYRPILC